MTEADTVAAIGLMAVATYLTRVAGVWLVGFAATTPRLQRTLHHLPGSVLAALVVPAAIGADAARLAGVIAACIVMLVTRRALLALILGTVFAGLLR